MKILFLSHKTIWRGVSVWMLRVSHYLRDAGHEIHILAHPGNPLWERDVEGLHVKPLTIRFDFDPRAVLYVSRYIQSHQIDVLIVNNPREIQIGGLAGLAIGVPVIRRIGRQDDFRDRWKDRFYHRKLILHSITTCDYIARDIEQEMDYVKAGAIEHIANFRDPIEMEASRRAAIRHEWGVAHDELLLGTMVALEKEKGILQILEALASVRDELPPWHYIICGDGSLKATISESVRRLNLSDRVTMVGRVQDSVEKSACFDIALIYSSMEGISHTLLEYFASGRPTISTDSGGLAEVVSHEHNALVVKWSDQEALERAIVRMSTDASLRSELGQQARRDLQDRFSTAVICKEWESWLQSCIT